MELEKPQIESRPLTFAELRVMSMQYADNPQISSVIDQAMKRRAADAPKEVLEKL